MINHTESPQHRYQAEPMLQDRKVQVTVLGAVGGAAMGSTGGGVRDAQATTWMWRNGKLVLLIVWVLLIV